MATEAALGVKLAENLVATGCLSRAEADRMRQVASEEAQSIGLLLARSGLVSERDVAAAYAGILGCPLLDDGEIPLALLPEQAYRESFLRESRIVPLGDDGERLRVATADPENAFALDALSMAVRRPITLAVATVSQIDRVLEAWFGADQSALAEPQGETVADDDAEVVDRLRDLASEAPVVRYVNLVIQRAVEARASDVHIESDADDSHVRYRIDGVLHRVETPSVKPPAAIVSRIKLMAKMNIAERRLPQDGRIQVRIQGGVIDLRVSAVPTVSGESVVLRILDQERVNLDLDTLGFDEETSVVLQRLIEAAHGIVLVTGSTGSGKTTTLYTLLQRLNTAERKILTIEDPVEYQLEGISQIQVKPQIGLDFAAALRSIVRQDPDVIMVGEMRDLETARIAIQSALTGHLVFSTLHTNDAGSSITRLLDMGVEDYLVTSAVNAVVAQRLVRRLCDECRRPYRPDPALVERLGLARIARGAEMLLHTSCGCPACGETGFRGRTAVAEVLVMTDSVRGAVLARADGRAIERLAAGEGMRTLWEDGLRQVLAGRTTVEEVARIAHEP